MGKRDAGMGMGKRDANSSKLSVDQYRKDIGKYENKRTKKNARKMKTDAQLKESSTTLRVGVNDR